MGDPFRSGPEPLACPACDNAIRELDGRLCCDACGGIMIAMAALTAAIAEYLQAQLGSPPKLRLVDVDASKRLCPRCNAPMTVGHLVADFEQKHPKLRPTL